MLNSIFSTFLIPVVYGFIGCVVGFLIAKIRSNYAHEKVGEVKDLEAKEEIVYPKIGEHWVRNHQSPWDCGVFISDIKPGWIQYCFNHNGRKGFFDYAMREKEFLKEYYKAAV